jgi:DNA-binding GntR family transcriptional regulator
MKKTQSLAERAYNTIKRDILTCVLDQGTLVAQSQMVEQYDFGITPVREALKRLEAEGYVQSIPRFGFVITPITIKDVEDLYELRQVLETASVRMAIQHASNEQIAEFRRRVDFTYTFKDRESYMEFLEGNIGFHVSIALMSGNRKLAEALSRVLNEMTRIFNLGLDLRDSAEEMRNEHVALASALASREVKRAEQIIEDQIRRSRQRVVEMLISRQEPRNNTEISFNMQS